MYTMIYRTSAPLFFSWANQSFKNSDIIFMDEFVLQKIQKYNWTKEAKERANIDNKQHNHSVGLYCKICRFNHKINRNTTWRLKTDQALQLLCAKQTNFKERSLSFAQVSISSDSYQIFCCLLNAPINLFTIIDT